VCLLPLVLKSYARAGTPTATATTITRTPTPTLAPGAFCVSPQPAFVTDTIVRQMPALAEPAARAPFRDAVLGSCVVRVTNYAQDRASDDPGGLKNEYARVQSFNADESRILVRGTAGTWYLYDARTLQPLGQMGIGGLGDPRWDTADPEVLYYFEDTRLLRYNVRTQGDAALVHDFGPDFPGQTLAAVWMRYEGSPSRDGRTWGLMAENEGWLPVALLVYDQQTDQVIARRALNPSQGDIDSVTISSLGGYFLASYESCPAGQTGTLTQPCGLMVYDRSLTQGRGLLPAIGHCDLALDAQGREVLVYQDLEHDTIAMLDLASGTVTSLWPIDFSHTALGLHFSGRAMARPGWAVVSTYNGGRPISYTWMDDQVFIVELRAGGRVVRLAHTHSQYDDSAGQDYWAEPHASTNRDLTRILFTSNWGRAATDQVDMYLIALPPDWSTRLP
jgi:hypothetical protein